MQTRHLPPPFFWLGLPASTREDRFQMGRFTDLSAVPPRVLGLRRRANVTCQVNGLMLLFPFLAEKNIDSPAANHCQDLSHDSWLCPSPLSLGPPTSIFGPIKQFHMSSSPTFWLQAPKGRNRWSQGRAQTDPGLKPSCILTSLDKQLDLCEPWISSSVKWD